MNARLFLALWPGPVTRNATAAAQRSIEWPEGTRLTAPVGHHVTLHFIGSVPAEQVESLALSVALPAGQIQLQLERLEVWRGGIAVLTSSRIPPGLADLHGSLAQALRREGVAVDERPYRPHVTLARRADVRPDGLARPVVWRSSGYVLVVSSGGTYTPIRRYGSKSAA